MDVFGPRREHERFGVAVVSQRGMSVVIPTIPPRLEDLIQCLGSVNAQERRADAVIVSTDLTHAGSAHTRNRGLNQVETEWTAFVDDDDVLLPGHLRHLEAGAVESGADVIYTGCFVIDQNAQQIPPREEWGRFGLPFDGDLLRERSWLPVTSMVRTGLAQEVGGFEFLQDPHSGGAYDDWGFYLRMLDAGATFHHVPIRTWLWRHHGYGKPGVPGNTSGSAARW